MAYTEAAKRRRRCLGTTKAGAPCRAYAVWDGPDQLCNDHCGRVHTGPQPVYTLWSPRPSRRTKPPNCTCRAYAWPHRPGGGWCRWPELVDG